MLGGCASGLPKAHRCGPRAHHEKIFYSELFCGCEENQSCSGRVKWLLLRIYEVPGTGLESIHIREGVKQGKTSSAQPKIGLKLVFDYIRAWMMLMVPDCIFDKSCWKMMRMIS